MLRPSTVRAIVLVAAVALPTAPHTHAQAAKPHALPVLIDTDAGDDIDDAFALAYALRSPAYDILGVTTTFRDTQLRAHLVLHLLDDAGRPGIFVAAGIPSSPPSDLTQAAYARADHHTLSTQSAVDLILSTARAHPHQVTLIAIGPLDNVGAAIDRDPAAFHLLHRVVLMGGSIRRGYGPPNAPPAPEWNILNNVAAARKLFASGVAIDMMPLDSTQITLPADLRQRILSQPTPLSKALAELVHEFNRPIVLYDPLTTAFATNPTLCPTQPMHITVDDKGNTLATPGKPNANVCLHSQEGAFLSRLTNTLTKP